MKLGGYICSSAHYTSAESVDFASMTSAIEIFEYIVSGFTNSLIRGLTLFDEWKEPFPFDKETWSQW